MRATRRGDHHHVSDQGTRTRRARHLEAARASYSHANGTRSVRRLEHERGAELNNPRRYRLIAAGLARRGHSQEVVAKVLGLNFLRVYKSVLQP